MPSLKDTVIQIETDGRSSSIFYFLLFFLLLLSFFFLLICCLFVAQVYSQRDSLPCISKYQISNNNNYG